MPISMRGLKLPSHVQIGAERRRRGWAASIARRVLPKSARLSLTRLCYILQGDSACLVGNRAGAAADIVEYCVGRGFLCLQKTSPLRDPKMKCAPELLPARHDSSPSFAGHQPLIACDCWICCVGAQDLGLHAHRKVSVMFPAPVEIQGDFAFAGGLASFECV